MEKKYSFVIFHHIFFNDGILHFNISELRITFDINRTTISLPTIRKMVKLMSKK